MDIGIDLGTASILVYVRARIVLQEPSVVAIDKSTGKMLAVGGSRRMIGRTHWKYSCYSSLERWCNS